MSITFKGDIPLVILVAEAMTVISRGHTHIVVVWKSAKDERFEEILTVFGHRRLC